ncbi:MAG TPA: sigma-70 family RNA polymerase sigma factor [Pyrinomonadaceae bacterium]|jgi:RNA polymerase sigma-70 factor (ECF subfamily)
MTHLELFAQHREDLYRQAYSILGNAMDAEDLLQETFLRWQQTDLTEVRSAKAFLWTILRNLCLNHVQSARVRHEKCLEALTDEPAATNAACDPQESESLLDSITAALQLLMERLPPKERLVLMLREVFDYDYEEIASIITNNNAACRQMLLRAKRHLSSSEPRFTTSPEQLEQLLRQFTLTCNNGDLDGLVTVLS